MKLSIPPYVLTCITDVTMFTTAIKKFHQDLNTQVLVVSEALKKAELGIEVASKTLVGLKELVEQEDFEDVPQEIYFFKHLKPCPMSYLIYFTEMRTCELRKPKAGASFQTRFYKKELRKINKFFNRNMNFVRYMEEGHTYLDHQFFTRNAQQNFPMTPMLYTYDYPDFSCSHDMLWAQVQAMYRLIHYIRDALKTINPNSEAVYMPQKHHVMLWSGSKTALVELIYALYASQYLNHGLSDLNIIVSSFEDFFNIKLDGVYKTYGEIKARKGSKTKFLEELILKLEYKIRQDDT
ncbi:RteC domain-containing protein [Leeuwenhoekiella palythoae]|uniref:RteC domain-containing protein n=1 Tax=Leeuwenhoekiella TaxID=283735 RepID=UPI001CE186EE|nr:MULTISPECIES: RteC domain-containing protein [Leeuwenhoekiella]UBZ10912.1 RteC domain-containing protein [Leeuwenhoekiella palythoae]